MSGRTPALKHLRSEMGTQPTPSLSVSQHMEIPASLQEVWSSFVLEPALELSNQGPLEKVSLAIVLGTLSSSPRYPGPYTVQSQRTDHGKGRSQMSLSICLVAHLPAEECNMALSLLASTTYNRALQCLLRRTLWLKEQLR